MDREFEIGQAGLKKVDGTARVDCPENAIRLHRLDMLNASRIENGITPVRDKRPVEISAEQPDVCSHESRHCRSESVDRQTAFSAVLPRVVRDLRLGR